MNTSITDRLEYLRGEIRAERISYGEIAELQSLAGHIDPSDVELLQWAGVPEFPDDAKTFVIIDWAGNKVNTGGKTFATFEDGWSWIYSNVEDEDNAYDDYFVVSAPERGVEQ